MNTITISSRELFSKCDRLARVINSKNSLPALDNFLFKVTDGTMYISASDTENFATATLSLVDSMDTFEFGLNARTFVSALKEIPEQPITIEISNNGCIVRYTNGHDKSMTDSGLYTYRIKRNISYDNIVHTFKVQQQGLGEEYGKGIRQGNGIQSVDVMFSQQGKSKPLPPTTFGEWLTDFDEYDAGDMDVKFHYGLKKTFGLSSSYRFEDSRFTLGLYLAMCKNRISQLDWNLFNYEQSHYVSIETGTTNLGTTVIVDKNGESITVEKYKETVSYIKPSKRGYSEQMDPDKEAEHKKVYSYVMVKPGIYINNRIQLDLGLGVARTQNTYRMEDAWQIKVIDKTYEKNGVANKRRKMFINVPGKVSSTRIMRNSSSQ